MTPQPRLERLEPSKLSKRWGSWVDLHNSHYWIDPLKSHIISKKWISILNTVWFWWLPNELTKTRPASFVDPGGGCWLLMPSRIVLPKTRMKWNKQKLLHEKNMCRNFKLLLIANTHPLRSPWKRDGSCFSSVLASWKFWKLSGRAAFALLGYARLHHGKSDPSLSPHGQPAMSS